MSEPFMSQISIFPLTYAVRDWAFCDGQILAIAQYNALFSLVGSRFGGNGVSTFGLPEMRGRVAVHRNTNGTYPLGQMAGSENQKLTTGNLPPHTHGNVFFAVAEDDGSENPGPGTVLSIPKVGDVAGRGYAAPDGSEVTLGNSGSRTVSSGQSTPFSIMDPFMCMSYEISLRGAYPSRS
ncbi:MULTISPECIES: phage tail protein [unclassified Leisingera]|uniref:phage tail protein n=1 Tax=unclassified Leisingera TaxID=2614906 RepID=UPI0009DFB64B|nr:MULTISPECIES: tail fiber protein [unclassified Leisingera]